MTSIICQDNGFFVLTEASNSVFWASGDTFAVTGWFSSNTIARTADSVVYTTGGFQSLCISEGGQGDVVVDQGRNLTLSFYEAMNPTIDIRSDIGAHLQLIGPNDTATQTPDGNGGTVVSVTGFGCGQADFIGVSHVNVVPAVPPTS